MAILASVCSFHQYLTQGRAGLDIVSNLGRSEFHLLRQRQL